VLSIAVAAELEDPAGKYDLLTILNLIANKDASLINPTNLIRGFRNKCLHEQNKDWAGDKKYLKQVQVSLNAICAKLNVKPVPSVL
jgi:hypothetical protein